VPQDLAEAPVVKGEHGVKDPLGGFIEPPRFPFPLFFQKLGGHHGGKGQGDESGDENSRRDAHGKLPEEPSHDALHKEHGDEYHHQGDRHGKDRKADLSGTKKRCGPGVFPLLHAADDILQHDDGVIDDKTYG